MRLRMALIALGLVAAHPALADGATVVASPGTRQTALGLVRHGGHRTLHRMR